MYQIVLFEPSYIVASTCGSETSFETELLLFSAHPTDDDATLLAESQDDTECTSVFFEASSPGTYYLTVGGVDAKAEGIFALSILCRDLSTPPVADLCGLQFITCGELRPESQVLVTSSLHQSPLIITLPRDHPSSHQPRCPTIPRRYGRREHSRLPRLHQHRRRRCRISGDRRGRDATRCDHMRYANQL
jgi:hypothetical protein